MNLKRTRKGAALAAGWRDGLLLLCACALVNTAIAGRRMAFDNVPKGSVVSGKSEPLATLEALASQQATQTIYVSVSGSDANDGSQGAPVLTLGRAAELAAASLNAGVSTCISLGAGTFTGPVTFDSTILNSTGLNTTLIITGAGAGQTVISGLVTTNQGVSYAASTWQPQPGFTNVYVHAWPNAVPLDAGPWADLYGMAFENLAARGEMIAVNGRVLMPVNLEIEDWVDPDGPGGNPGALQYGGIVSGGLSNLTQSYTFMVSSDPNAPAQYRDKIFIRLPAGSNINTMDIKIAPTNALVLASYKDNMVVKKLSVCYGGGNMLKPALAFNNCDNVVVQDVQTAWNNGTGLRLAYVNNALVERVTASDNGYKGVNPWTVSHVLFDYVTAARNNWRGLRGGWTGWDAAGIKIGAATDVLFRRPVFIDNDTHGLWLDVQCKDVVMDSVFSYGNLNNGLYLELSDPNSGRYEVRDSVLAANGGDGIYLAEVANAWSHNNVIADNGTSVHFNNDSRAPNTTAEFGQLRLNDNVVVDHATSGPLVKWDGTWQNLMAAVEQYDNQYFSTYSSGAATVGGTSYSWSSYTNLLASYAPAGGAEAGSTRTTPAANTIYWETQTVTNRTLTNGQPFTLNTSTQLFSVSATFSVTNPSVSQVGLQIGSTQIVYNVSAQQLDGVSMPPVGGKVTVRVVVDRPLMEVIGNSNQVYYTKARTAGAVSSIQAFATGGNATLTQLDIRDYAAVWSAPTLPTPPDGSANYGYQRVLLTWVGASGAAGYNVYFGTATNSLSLLASTTNAQAVVSVNTNQTYYWAVDTKDTNGAVRVVGDIWSFTTGSGEMLVHWRLDDATGLAAADATGNGHSAAISSASSWTNGIVGGALAYSGGSAAAGTLNANLGTANQMTYCAWVNLTQTGDEWIGADRLSNPQWLIRNSGANFDMHYWDGSFRQAWQTAYPRELMTNQWRHVAVTYDVANRTMVLYVDGVMLSSTTVSKMAAQPLGSIIFGARLNGRLDDIRVYNAVLTSQDVQDVYNDRSVPPLPPPFTSAKDSFVVNTNPAFGYVSGQPFDNGTSSQGPATTGISTWKWRDLLEIGTWRWQSDATGLAYPGIVGSGGCARWTPDGSSVTRSVGRLIDSPFTAVSGQVYWMSVLVRVDGALDPDFDSFAYAGFGNTQNPFANLTGGNPVDDPQGFWVGVKGDGFEMNLVLLHRTGGGVMTYDVLTNGLALGQTHLVLIKAKVDGGNYGDIDGVWVDPTDVSSEAALGPSATVATSMALFSTGGYSFDRLSLYASGLENSVVRFDEMTLSTSLTKVLLPNDYANWAAAQAWTYGSAKTGPNDDYDGDGRSNDYERLFGQSPTSASSSSPFVSPLSRSTGTFIYTRRDPALTGLTYGYQYSTNLATGSWTNVIPSVADIVVAGPGAGNQTVTVNLTGAPGNPLANTKLFVRLVATP